MRRWLGLRRLVRWLALGLGGVLVLLVGAGVVAGWLLWPTDLPSVKALEEYAPSPGTKVYADDDELLTEFQAERRIFTPLREIPKALRDAVIAVEDARFYSHHGIDVRGIVRAAVANFREQRIVEGGSTITQQLAKVLFLTPDRRFARKIKEAFLALELENRYSKDRLLELYLNQIYLGHGAYGVEAAARAYFGRSVRELGLHEMALLAGLPRAPQTYSPFEHPDRARARRNHVLARMVEQGYLDAHDAQRAQGTTLGVLAPDRRRGSGQYFLGYLEQSLEARFGSDLLYKGGLAVYTTLNSRLQRAAEAALRDGLGALAARHPQNGAAPQGAVVIIEVQTGYLKALVGGSDFARTEFNRAVHARRQPGSAFKPFVYIAALEAGRRPSDLIEDSPVRYTAGPGKVWEPENYDGKFRGPLTLQEALEHSVNVPTVKLAEEVGVDRLIRVARRFGIESPLQANLTLALGSSDVTLLELTAAYAALANHGVRMDPIAIRYFTDARGNVAEENIPQGREVVGPVVASTITEMLRGAVTRGTAVQARVLGRPVAGKTGTTNDFSNAWFIGYTPSVAAGVWVGHDRVRSLGRDETGARAALPIWIALMRQVLLDQPVEDFPPPEAIARGREDGTGPASARTPAVAAPPAPAAATTPASDAALVIPRGLESGARDAEPAPAAPSSVPLPPARPPEPPGAQGSSPRSFSATPPPER